MKKWVFGALLLVLVFSMVGCGGGGGGGIVWNNSLTVTNNSPIYLDIYYGGVYFAGLYPGESAVVTNIVPGTYIVEAYDVYGYIYYSELADIVDGFDTYVTVPFIV